MTPRHLICEQTEHALRQLVEHTKIVPYIHELKGQQIVTTTYQDAIRNQLDLGMFDLVICDEAHFVKRTDVLLDNGKTKYLGIMQNTEVCDGEFHDAECLFSYTIKDAVNDGYGIGYTETKFIQQFLIKLLDYQKYRNIFCEVGIHDGNKSGGRVDVIAQKDNNSVVIEVKLYRSIHNSKVILNNALKQILQYKEMILKNNNGQEISFVIVMPCEIEDEVQKEIYERYKVIIWDINNLIYLCGENKELLHLLMSCIPFPLLEFKEKNPLEMQVEEEVIEEESILSFTEMYQKKLDCCRPGKAEKADKQYEAICTEIIKYLFETEFYKISEQHKTEDEMFRMDLLCSLKGSTEFWKFLITFYHTKFVVFEYKNYSDFISQDLIYVTEKYLFPVALRNVAFIISRKGFNPNAQTAAIGCLRENGKLVIDLNDEDLIKMISMKENGKEPSDYLLDKVEEILMSVSK